ncbi:MAG: hypothetical protein ACTSVI_02650 [Promethearchaeota archaeon]
MNFSSFLKEIGVNMLGSKVAHQMTLSVNVGFIDKRRIDSIVKGESLST